MLTRLQWVHGPITVVMLARALALYEGTAALQWVHGPITVVMRIAARHVVHWFPLQWVHGPITVVMGPIQRAGHDGLPAFNGSTVR